MRKAVAMLLLLVGCSLSEVIDVPVQREREPETYTPRKKAADSTQRDTARVPISFGVSIDNWGDEEDVDCSSN